MPTKPRHSHKAPTLRGSAPRRPAASTSHGASIGSPYRSAFDAVRMLQEGVPVEAVGRLQRASGLTMERIKQVSRISEGSLARKRRTGRLSADQSERLLRIARTFEHALSLFDGDRDSARQWLETPIPSLDGFRPLDLARTEPGAREVDDLIGRIENGVVS